MDQKILSSRNIPHCFSTLISVLVQFEAGIQKPWCSEGLIRLKIRVNVPELLFFLSEWWRSTLKTCSLCSKLVIQPMSLWNLFISSLDLFYWLWLPGISRISIRAYWLLQTRNCWLQRRLYIQIVGWVTWFLTRSPIHVFAHNASQTHRLIGCLNARKNKPLHARYRSWMKKCFRDPSLDILDLIHILCNSVPRF